MRNASETKKSLNYELEILIEAPLERVWSSLVDETNAWWLPDFHMVGADSVVTFDAQAGGALIERTPDGGSLLWYTVQMVLPQKSIHMQGHMAPGWGGPAISMLEFALEEKSAATLFTVRDALIGDVTEKTANGLCDGWKLLFGEGLAKHAEQS